MPRKTQPKQSPTEAAYERGFAAGYEAGLAAAKKSDSKPNPYADELRRLLEKMAQTPTDEERAHERQKSMQMFNKGIGKVVNPNNITCPIFGPIIPMPRFRRSMWTATA